MRSIGIGQKQLRARERSANFFSFDLPPIIISKSPKFMISLHRENDRWTIASFLVVMVVTRNANIVTCDSTQRHFQYETNNYPYLSIHGSSCICDSHHEPVRLYANPRYHRTSLAFGCDVPIYFMPCQSDFTIQPPLTKFQYRGRPK
jgi:hypothetical protein